MSMDHEETVVSPHKDDSKASLPSWASLFRRVVEQMRRKDAFERLPELIETQRRADAAGLIDVVLFLVAYQCAQPTEGGLREFWYQLREVEQRIAALAGRRGLPSSSSVSRFLKSIQPEQARAIEQWMLREATALDELGGRPETHWLDTHGEGWLVLDWDPKARLVRERTVIDGEEYPPVDRWGETMGEPGQVGRKRGKWKWVRGLVAHAGTGQWLGAYRQAGNGTLLDEIGCLESVSEAIDRRLGDELDHPPIIRVDGEGGEVPVLHGLREAGLCPLVRLKQYSLLETSEVQRVIEQTEPTEAEGAGTGPVREVYEIGNAPLTSSRSTEQLHRWDRPLEIRLIVTRYRRTEIDDGPGVAGGEWRYEMFGTDLPAESWPAEAVVDGYFGRATIENRFAVGDCELELEKVYSQGNPAGQYLATVTRLWAWNLLTEIGDEYLESEPVPAPSAKSEPTERPRGGLEQDGCDHSTDPPDQLSDKTRQRLEDLQMSYDPERGVIECAAGHLLVPRKRGKKDQQRVGFRTRGRPCRGCPHRDTCTSSTRTDFRKEVSIWNEEVPEARKLADGQQLPPGGIELAGKLDCGPSRIRRPTYLPTAGRKAARRHLKHVQLSVDIQGDTSRRLARTADEAISHRRQHQRLPNAMRRRYYKLPPTASVHICWESSASRAPPG